MFVSDCLGINEKGHLTIGGKDTVSLAAKYGTPLMVFDEYSIRANMRHFRDSIDKYYDGNGMALYASKAFSCKEMCRIADSEGLGLDVVSGGEIYTALAAGFPAERMFFHGNNKTDEEIRYALNNGVGRFIVDNPEELRRLDTAAGELGICQKISLRIKPGIDAHTHEFIKTGQIDSKFGFAIETGEAMECVKLAIGFDNVELVGLHCHIGSQVFEVDPFVLAAKVMMRFIADIWVKFGRKIKELNLGGGFGIKYSVDDNPLPLGGYMEPVSGAIKAAAKEYGVDIPYILLEPGRSIVGAEGITLYKVGSVKTIPGVRTYVSVDGGMSDNPRYILYQSEYTVLVADRAGEERNTTVTLAGKCCESGDLIQEHTKTQEVKAGDIIAVLTTGAYCYSMASNYNRIPRPEVLLVKDGKARTIIKRETYEQVCINDI